MRTTFRSWFNHLRIIDPTERQQAGVMQAILLILLAITILGIPISLSDPLVAMINVILFGVLCVALRALRRGAFRLSVRIVVGVMVVSTGLSMQVVSLRTAGPLLFSFAIPLTLAALLLSRRDLIVAAVFSTAVVAAAAVHDILDPREGGLPVAPNPGLAISQAIVFLLVAILVTFVLDRFGASLRRVLRDATVREQELAQVQSSLEKTVAEQTAQLSAEVQAGHAREAQLVQTLAELRASQDLVRALSAPVIPVLPGVLVAPIVGGLDDVRAKDLTKSVLQAIERQQARALILDVTGVSLIDAKAARMLLDTAGAARLIGASVLLAGIRPEVAQAIVALELSLNLRTYATLQETVEALIAERAL
jgi:anti-anti-sigma factor